MTEPLFPEDAEWERRSKIFGTSEFRQAYQRYINSSSWKKLTKEVQKRAHHRCERCGKFFIRLEIHHLTYERFQNELVSDLQALCQNCHRIADQERIAENQRKFEEAGEEARYENARDTYLTKKYGEDYYIYDCPEFDEEFDSWLERKQENAWYSY